MREVICRWSTTGRAICWQVRQIDVRIEESVEATEEVGRESLVLF